MTNLNLIGVGVLLLLIGFALGRGWLIHIHGPSPEDLPLMVLGGAVTFIALGVAGMVANALIKPTMKEDDR